MFQGFAQLCIALLDFFEQSHVLNGNHCLVSEGLEKGDLLFGEGTDIRPTDRYGTDGHILAEKRRRHRRSDTKLVSAPLDFTPVRMLDFAPCNHVLNVYCRPVEYGAAGEEVTADCPALADRHEA